MLSSPPPQLRLGQKIPAVQDLQILLAHHGFMAHSDIDGHFGPRTEMAVKAFQNAKNLTVDGVVGTLTWERLSSNHFSDAEKSLIDCCRQCGVVDLAQIAYILATSQHESGQGRWMEEWDTGDAYDGRIDLGNTRPGDGSLYKGRGYVQITGRGNYVYWSDRLGIDLVTHPELAAQPDIAAQIIVLGMRDGTFTGYRLAEFVEGERIDFRRARQVVNGLDRADDISAIAQRYFTLLRSQT